MTLPVPSDAIIRSVQLARYLTRIVSEAAASHADAIAFTVRDQELHGEIRKGMDVIRPLTMERVWLARILEWFRARRLVAPENFNLPDRGPGFYAGLRAERGGIIVHVTSDEVRGTATITGAHGYHPPHLGQLYGFAPNEAMQWEYLTEARTGTLLMMGPRQVDVDRALHTFLSSSRGHYAGDLADPQVLELVRNYHGEHLVVISSRGGDVLEGVRLLRSARLDPYAVCLQGIVCQCFLRGVCPQCARETEHNGELVAKLPPKLRSRLSTYARVGRGCSACGESGHGPLVGLSAIALWERGLSPAFEREASGGSLAEALLERGTEPLLADGVDRAAQGVITLDGLFEVVHSIPADYQEYFRGAPSHDDEDRGGVVENISPRILVVDDDSDQRAILEMVLRSAGYLVETACDGVEALQKLKQQQPDLVVTDLMMPRLDGAELVKRIRAHWGRRELPILVLTVVSDQEREYQLLDLGADDYCEKTINRKLLLKRIERLRPL